MPPDQSIMSMRGRVGAYVSWSRTSDPSARTAPARRAANDRFQREVDPDGSLPVAERRRRADAARRAHMQRLALRSAVARRKAADARRVADAADAEQAAEQAAGQLDGAV